MSTWEEIAVPDALLDTSVGKQHQVLAQDIAPSGAYPVIDQGQSFIAGYCDDPSRVIDFALPVIIFGDHTRAFKYVDFPFVLGADGTKVLKPDPEQFDARYFYYAMLALDIPNRGYNRHFKILRERFIPKPPLPEQQRIAQVLSTVQTAIEQQERLIRTTTELKQALMQKLFTEGLRGEAQKETEIGLVPESWEVVALRDVCDFQSGGTPSKQRPEYWLGSIPWVSPKDMKRPRLSDVIDHISEEGLDAGSRLAPAGSVLIVIRGMILAKDVPVALTEVPMAINQDMKAIIPHDRLHPDYLLYSLAAFKERLFHRVGRSAHGTMTLMSEEIFGFNIPLPGKDEQASIAAALFNLETKVEHHTKRRNALQALFRTLLHELMTGKVRVNSNS